MALDRMDKLDGTSPEFRLRGDDRNIMYDDEGGRSSFGAFLLGGVVVAGGLLAFLYYDVDTLNRDELTTGSIGRIEMPSPATSPNIATSPAPSDGRPVR